MCGVIRCDVNLRYDMEESLEELPIYVNCICNECGHKWESQSTGKCPKCHSKNINQNAMIRGL